jgi:hypothetical protein
MFCFWSEFPWGITMPEDIDSALGLQNVHHKLMDGQKDGLTDATRTILLAQLVSWAKNAPSN